MGNSTLEDIKEMLSSINVPYQLSNFAGETLLHEIPYLPYQTCGFIWIFNKNGDFKGFKHINT